jgi:type II secretory pathway component PulF
MLATFVQSSGGTSWDIRSMLAYPSFTAFFGLFLLLWLAIILLPFGKLLKRTGHHAAWCLFFIIPFVNVIALWIFAFKRWPTDKATTSDAAPVQLENRK